MERGTERAHAAAAAARQVAAPDVPRDRRRGTLYLPANPGHPAADVGRSVGPPCEISPAVTLSVPRARWISLWFLVLSLGALAQCSSPSEPTPPPPPTLAVSCPQNIVVEQAATIPIQVGYPPATATGGVAPVTVTCTHPSGTAFNLGKTDVVCNAADSAPATNRASCSFSVTVSQSFHVGVTKFLAFGDSITKGEVEYNLASGRRILAIEPDKAYPTVLGRLLTARYPQQQVQVDNYAQSGMPATCPLNSDFCGVALVSDAIRRTEPQALLLLQGVIDLSGGGDLDAIDPMVDGLKSMIRDARARAVPHVFLSTLLPQKEATSFPKRNVAMDLIASANDEIRYLAATENVYLVDAYSVFVGNEATYIGADGLHPTHAGYEALAGAFFSQIQARLETVVSTPAGLQRMLRVSAPNGPHVEIGFQGPRPSIRVR